MNSSGSWRRISQGDPHGKILAVDFDTSARPEAGFKQLAARLVPHREIWLTTQPDAADRELLPAAEYLRHWQDQPGEPGGQVTVIMGYCVGGVFAAALADRIGHQQGSRPALLLFDPEPVVIASLHRDFATAVSAMSILAEQERADWIAEAGAACAADDRAASDIPASTSAFDTAARQVIKLYEAAAGRAFDQLGLDPETSEDLLAVYRSYVSYLSAAQQLDPAGGWAEAAALTSANSSPGARCAAAEQCFGVSTAELLDTGDVAAAASRFLAEHGS